MQHHHHHKEATTDQVETNPQAVTSMSEMSATTGALTAQ